MENRLILFFDTYISSSIGPKTGSTNDKRRAIVLEELRNKKPNARFQEKIEVVKYTLASYSVIKWDDVIIRFECEEPEQNEHFFKFAKDLFPTAQIYYERSDTAQKYLNAFTSSKLKDEDWIFFSPNNDHPFLAHPDIFSKLMTMLEETSKRFQNYDVCLKYSHFTEGINSNKLTDSLFGYYYNSYKKILFENEIGIVTKSSKLLIDSICIFKLEYLKRILSSTKNSGRLIRLEDTEFYGSKNLTLIEIQPKFELCRHYDSYVGLNMSNFVPVLFIPPGFFDYNIKIRYGYDSYLPEFVNVNPYKDLSNTDLQVLIEDLPYFWLNRVSTLIINPEFPKKIDRNSLENYKLFNNPWYKYSKCYFLIKSVCKIIYINLYDFIFSFFKRKKIILNERKFNSI
jgi:hypothetical protein